MTPRGLCYNRSIVICSKHCKENSTFIANFDIWPDKLNNNIDLDRRMATMVVGMLSGLHTMAPSPNTLASSR